MTIGTFYISVFYERKWQWLYYSPSIIMRNGKVMALSPDFIFAEAFPMAEVQEQIEILETVLTKPAKVVQPGQNLIIQPIECTNKMLTPEMLKILNLAR